MTQDDLRENDMGTLHLPGAAQDSTPAERDTEPDIVDRLNWLADGDGEALYGIFDDDTASAVACKDIKEGAREIASLRAALGKAEHGRKCARNWDHTAGCSCWKAKYQIYDTTARPTTDPRLVSGTPTPVSHS